MTDYDDSNSENAAMRPKWLALHNFRSTADVFKQQLLPLTSSVLKDVDIDFVEAPHPGRADPGGSEWWASPTFKNYMMGWIGDVGLDESIAFLREKIHKDGPYQGVIGFSQGASMAHYLLSAGLVTRGILFSPVLPLGRAWPPLENRQYSAVIFFDPADMTGESYPRKGMTEVLHNENHSVPLLTDQIRDEITRITSL